MAMQQELADLSAEVKELRREASSIANATEQTLNELLQHMEALQKVQTDARDARSQTLRPPVSLGGPGIPGRSSRMNVGQRPRPQALDVPSDGPWKSRFENFILKQREQAERLAAASSDEASQRLEQALADATFVIEDADCTPSMRSFLMTTLQILNALAAAESRRRSLLAPP
mmetsp:Transcript_6596/g.11367  ORF Transcript_6596/g.11367 Transcript_6596/m.11367 type:complete len:173 (+) Transcript_6596:43-561(+)